MVSQHTGEKRQELRRGVSSQAEVSLGGVGSTGLVLDISPGGVFFGPMRRWQDEHFVTTTPFAQMVGIGDQVVLRFREDWYTEEVESIALLRWSGFSPRHHCFGFGLSFDPL